MAAISNNSMKPFEVVAPKFLFRLDHDSGIKRINYHFNKKNLYEDRLDIINRRISSGNSSLYSHNYVYSLYPPSKLEQHSMKICEKWSELTYYINNNANVFWDYTLGNIFTKDNDSDPEFTREYKTSIVHDSIVKSVYSILLCFSDENQYTVKPFSITQDICNGCDTCEYDIDSHYNCTNLMEINRKFIMVTNSNPICDHYGYNYIDPSLKYNDDLSTIDELSDEYYTSDKSIGSRSLYDDISVPSSYCVNKDYMSYYDDENSSSLVESSGSFESSNKEKKVKSIDSLSYDSWKTDSGNELTETDGLSFNITPKAKSADFKSTGTSYSDDFESYHSSPKSTGEVIIDMDYDETKKNSDKIEYIMDKKAAEELLGLKNIKIEKDLKELATNVASSVLEDDQITNLLKMPKGDPLISTHYTDKETEYDEIPADIKSIKSAPTCVMSDHTYEDYIESITPRSCPQLSNPVCFNSINGHGHGGEYWSCDI